MELKQEQQENNNISIITLTGALIKYFQIVGEAKTFEQIMHSFQNYIELFENSRGQDYKGDEKKIMLGTLNQKKIFYFQNQQWNIQNQNILIYQQQLAKKLLKKYQKNFKLYNSKLEKIQSFFNQIKNQPQNLSIQKTKKNNIDLDSFQDIINKLDIVQSHIETQGVKFDRTPFSVYYFFTVNKEKIISRRYHKHIWSNINTANYKMLQFFQTFNIDHLKKRKQEKDQEKLKKIIKLI